MTTAKSGSSESISMDVFLVKGQGNQHERKKEQSYEKSTHLAELTVLRVSSSEISAALLDTLAALERMKKIYEYPSSSLAASSMKGFFSAAFDGLPRPLLLHNRLISISTDKKGVGADARGCGGLRGSLSGRHFDFGRHDGKEGWARSSKEIE